MASGKALAEAASFVAQHTTSVAESTIKALSSVGVNISWNQLPEHVKGYINAHPGLTALQIVGILVALCPGLIAGPALAGLGFSSIGPVAGTTAAAYQSANGASVVFAIAQSAAMGGYGLPIINGIVSAGGAIGAGVAGAAKFFRYR